ncbi:putative HTH-type transcriptional regulator ypdC [Erwinia piriflorinigrans CFBP 5888]|uniref:Putative HTH-type transcriptional regulator ypdC n=1 Tax=Erwinia piriflorinigrans CFBP 5888 TaxID=1161919 RepID=V5Z9T6_9GAMM|nr:putative HTH-type transcriptional regulator ypdC [Erwinia piriflorinigrans CFBP 5888]
MLIPINFLLSLVCLLLLAQRRDAGRVFQILLLLCLLHTLVAGMAMLSAQPVWHKLQPITACTLPLICRVALCQAQGQPIRYGWSLTSLGMMIVSVLLLPQLIDWLLPAIWLGCAGAMQLQLRSGRESFHQVALQHGDLTLRGWQVTVLLLIGIAVLDVIATLLIAFTHGNGLPVLLLLGNVLVCAVLSLALSLTPIKPLMEPIAEKKRQVTRHQAGEQEQENVMVKVEALMRGGLYREPDLSLARLARKAGTPGRQISAAVNALNQQNVSQYVNGWRIREACEQLRCGQQSVIEVMESVGFQTKSNFNREFRRVTGKTPSQWRQATEEE